MQKLLMTATALMLGVGSAALATDLNVVIEAAGCDDSNVTVGPACELQYRVIGELSDAASQGLALVVFDLAYDGGPLAQADWPTDLPMSNFLPPAGFSRNPDGFGGTVDGAGLLQVGGAQNVFLHGQWACDDDLDCPASSYCDVDTCAPIAGLPTGALITGVAQPGSPVVIVKGAVTTPATPGTYSLSIASLGANVVRADATGEAYWATESAGLGTVANLVLNVEEGADCCPTSCCLPSGECEMLNPLGCDGAGGLLGFVSICLGDGNENGVDDACEILAKRPAPWEYGEYGGSCEQDSDCWGPAETVAYCVPADDGSFPGICYAPTNRYISIARNPDQAADTARRIVLQGGGAGPWWVGSPTYNAAEDMYFASVSPTSVYADIDVGEWVDGDWPDVIHVKGCEIAPAQTYEVQAIQYGSDEADEGSFSEVLALETAPVWGDIVSSCAFDHCLPPTGSLTEPSIDDVLAVVNAFTGVRNAPLPWMDVDPVFADGEPEGMWALIGDVLGIVNAFTGDPYPGNGPLGCE